MKQMKSETVPVIVMGLGSIGLNIVRAACQSSELEIVGAVDVHPNLRGKHVGKWLNEPRLDFEVAPDLQTVAQKHAGAVVLQATFSRLPEVEAQLMEAVRLGLSVVSTCEELSFPFLKYPELSEKLDRAAQKAGVSILGTGVNPGFVLDRLVATLGQVCGPVRHVTATRVVDARTRREALQRKVGAGLKEDEFHALADEDKIGHVGLVESAALAAVGLGLDCDDFEEELVPVLADEDIHGGAVVVRKGQVAGMSQVAVGLQEGQERVRLELTIALGVEPAYDQIVIESDSRVDMVIKGGIAGDMATAHTVVHAAPRLKAADAGLLTVLELPAAR